MDIQIDKFKDYKVVNNPKAAQIIDSSINLNWWDNEGWSYMYDSTPKDFKKLLSSGWDTSGITRGLETLSFKRPSEISDKLQGVFDFIEKKEGKANPLKAEEVFSDPKALYPGKLGFGYINDEGEIKTFPYPASGLKIENTGEIVFYITGIKDGGIVVWNDALEKNYALNYGSGKDGEDYII